VGFVFVNHALLTSTEQPCSALFLSWYQCGVTFVILIIATVVFPTAPIFNQIPYLHYDWKVLVAVAPVSLLYTAIVVLDNRALQELSVSSYFILRSLVVVFGFIFNVFLGQRTPSFRASLACLHVITGFAFGIAGEEVIPISGTVCGVLSSFFVSLYSILVAKSLKLLNNNPIAVL
jgi:hypothetical protein